MDHQVPESQARETADAAVLDAAAVNQIRWRCRRGRLARESRRGK